MPAPQKRQDFGSTALLNDRRHHLNHAKACGDILRLSARFEADVAVEVRYKVRGCTASIAAGSALTEWIQGKTRAQIAAFHAAIVDQAVGGLAAESKHAATLCADGVKLLLEQSRRGA
ncbi:MAG: iron-sulfur cluster assembly scaffold protein [Bryobacteraceae bacterium]